MLVVVNILLFVKYKNEVKQTTEQKEIIKTVFVDRDNIKSDLVKLKDEYANLQTNDKKLQAEIDELKEELEDIVSEHSTRREQCSQEYKEAL